MLTAIPARVLHALRGLAAALLVLADLGLEVCCDCGHDHNGALAELEHGPYARGGLVPGGPVPVPRHPGEQYYTRQQVETL